MEKVWYTAIFLSKTFYSCVMKLIQWAQHSVEAANDTGNNEHLYCMTSHIKAEFGISLA